MILDVEFEEMNIEFEADFGEVIVIKPGGKTYSDGLAEGEAVGREKCWNEYWDTTQQNGERTNYSYAFAYEKFKAENFCPKYDITPGKAAGTFAYSAIDKPIIMSEWEQKNGIRFDASYCSDFNQTFRDSNVFREINVLDVSGVNASVNTVTLSVLFFGNQTIQRINRLICGSKTTFVNTSFNGCTTIEYIGFDGVISGNGLDLHWSPLLNKDSIISLFNTLSTATTGLTVTLSRTAVANAFETAVGLANGASSEEWLALVASRSNWTISLI